MKLIFAIFCGLIISVWSRPQQAPAEIVLYETDVGDTNYNFKYETSDGIARDETGGIRDDPNDPEGILSVQGSYTYIDDKGKEHLVKYTADEKGFRILPESRL